MGLMSFLKKQFLDVIELPEFSGLIMKYPMEDQEIQNGATLVVREAQFALFVNEGKLADAFGPGTYKLTTQTLPLMTNLKNWDKLFSSPFKSDVYFINTRLMLNNGWGTQQPVTVRDKDFGMVRVRGFGKYSYRINDAKKFFQNVGGSDIAISDNLDSQLKNIVISAFASSLANSEVPFLDLAANQAMLAELIKSEVSEKFNGL